MPAKDRRQDSPPTDTSCLVNKVTIIICNNEEDDSDGARGPSPAQTGYRTKGPFDFRFKRKSHLYTSRQSVCVCVWPVSVVCACVIFANCYNEPRAKANGASWLYLKFLFFLRQINGKKKINKKWKRNAKEGLGGPRDPGRPRSWRKSATSYQLLDALVPRETASTGHLHWPEKRSF